MKFLFYSVVNQTTENHFTEDTAKHRHIVIKQNDYLPSLLFVYALTFFENLVEFENYY